MSNDQFNNGPSDLNAVYVPHPGSDPRQDQVMQQIHSLQSRRYEGAETGAFPAAPITREPPSGHVDLASLVRAQARFITAQTAFLRNAGASNLSEEQYLAMLQQYSYEQALYSKAQAEALRQLGVF